MNSETVTRYGKYVMFVLWLLECLCSIAIIRLVVGRNFTVIFSVVVFMFVGFLIMLQMSRKMENSFPVFCYAFFCFASLLGIFMCVITQSSFFLLYISFIEWLIACFSFRKEVANRLLLIQAASLLVLLAWNVFGTEGDYNLNVRDVIVTICCMALCCWIVIGFISILNEQQKKNNNQQQSLDDLLYIVESLRDEATGQAEKQVSEISYMANAIHRLNRTVHSMNEAIAKESDIEKIHEYSGIIAESVGSIHKMTEEISTFMRLEKGEVVLQEKPYDLGKLLWEIVEDIHLQAEKKNLSLLLSVGENVPRRFIGDCALVGDVFRILLSNAVQYTDRGTIEIKIFQGKQATKEDAPQICVDVCDTGRGIKEKDLQQIFKPYYHVEEYNTRNGYHSGLGLYIASQYAALLKGELSVESEYGKGSTFHFHFEQIVDCEEEQGQNGLFTYMEEMANLVGQARVTEQLKTKAKSPEREHRIENIDNEIDLPPILGIDWNVALQFLATRKNILDTLEQFHKSGYENLKQLRDCFNEIGQDVEDAYHLFQIKAHSMKSNLKMIGAMELSEQAKELEYAARDKDKEMICASTVVFIDACTELLIAVGKIPEIVNKNRTIRESYDKGAVTALLDEVIKAMENFDMESADETMKKLEGYEYPQQIQEFVNELSGKVLNLDTDGAKESIAKIKELIQ